MANKDGILGAAATYQYEYDNWRNLTRVIDPYGTETRMAYLNTDSNKNLSQFNPNYQNYIFIALPELLAGIYWPPRPPW